MLLELLLPDRCVCCGRPGTSLCDPCGATLRRLRPPLCERCGAPVVVPVARCRECAGRRLAFVTARAAIAYEGPAVPLVRAWKEQGRRGLARPAAAIVVATVPAPTVAAITYVPAAVDRALWRGHNTAHQLARALADLWQIPCRSLLDRRGASRPQRGLPLATRRANVAGAFTAVAEAPRRVCLVDDVFTTGSTLDAAASALRRAGARSIEVVTLARTLRD